MDWLQTPHLLSAQHGFQMESPALCSATQDSFSVVTPRCVRRYILVNSVYQRGSSIKSRFVSECEEDLAAGNLSVKATMEQCSVIITRIFGTIAFQLTGSVGEGTFASNQQCKSIPPHRHTP